MTHRQHRLQGLVLSLTFLLRLASCAPAAADAASGWRRVEVPATGSYFTRYVPASLDRSRPAPVVIFLHGSGGTPETHQRFVEAAAERVGCVVALPKSVDRRGWGFSGDELTVAESLRLVGEELPVDASRVGIAGHSAGGAYAYLLAYGTSSHYSAVFSMSAPSYPVAAVADPGYTAPIRMYYGTRDFNYTGGSYAALKQQWDRLGVPWEEDLQTGYGHSTWPADTVEKGFRFLAGHAYPSEVGGGACVPGPTTLCLGDGRFRVEVAWRDFQGGTGPGRVVPGAAADSGLFWFFAPDNWELLVKVLDGCGVNDHRWVFAAATTNVGYTLTVTDTVTGEVARYENALGVSAPAITDTEALAGCP